MNAIAANLTAFRFGGLDPYRRTEIVPTNSPTPIKPAIELVRECRDDEFQNELADVLSEIQEDESYKAPQPESVSKAKEFVNSLPETLPAGAPSVTPSGEILIQWTRGRSSVFIVKLGNNGKLYFASRLPGERFQGAVDYTYGTIPSRVVSEVAKWAEQQD